MDMKTRLNEAIRWDMTSALVARAFDDKQVEARAWVEAAAAALYDAVVPPQLQETLRGVPSEFLREGPHGYVRAPSGRTDTLHFPPGMKHAWRGYRDVPEDLFSAYCEAVEASRDLREERNSALQRLTAALSKFRTAGDIASAWPDALPVLRPIIDAAAASRPSTALVDVAGLNKLCGLPVVGETA